MRVNARGFDLLHFGPRGAAGHHLTAPDGLSVRDIDIDRLRLPKPSELDGGLFLPRPAREGDGACTHLPGVRLSILAWWGSPFDRRGAVNQALIVPGRITPEEIWALFAKIIPDLHAAVLPAPTIVASWDGLVGRLDERSAP